MAPQAPLPRKSSLPDLFTTLQEEVNRVFDRVFGAATPLGFGGFAPSVEMKETDSALIITAELPGMEEKDVELTLDGDILTIAGEKKQEKTEEKEGYHFSERSYGSFRRSLRLPWAADPASAEASFDKGVLTIRLPRPPEDKAASRRIPIGTRQTAA